MTDEVKVDQIAAAAKDAAERAAKNVSVAPQALYAPILFALQDAFPALQADLQADLQFVRRLTIKYHGLGMDDPAQWRVGLEEIVSIVAEEGAGPDTRDAAALQAENERLREVLGKINAIEDAEYPSEDEYGYESCHVEGYNAGLSECRKTILLALKDTPND